MDSAKTNRLTPSGIKLRLEPIGWDNDGHYCDFPDAAPGVTWECPVCHWRWMAVEDINWTAVNE